MSHRLISRSDDLQKLQDEGYEIDVIANWLIVRHVPYLDANKALQYGALMCPLVLENDVTAQPDNHTMMFDGAVPCDESGNELKIVADHNAQTVAEGVSYQHTFSRKPLWEGNRYKDFHQKTVTYVEFISSHAQSVDPDATARTYRHVPVVDGEDSVFRYRDTASARAHIQLVTDKLNDAGPVAIIGLGGTGSYILDQVAKTPVSEIHLYDGDRFSQHNAFRSPGAPAGEELDGGPMKVDYFHAIYDHMHSGIRPHGHYLQEANIDELEQMKFVFLAIDDSVARREIVDKLESLGTPFIDVGLGVYEHDTTLGGMVRTTTSTPETRDVARSRLPFAAPGANNEYRTNIQIADLNALNAALAVIKWKKLVGFYQDTDREQHALYVIGGNTIINEDQA
jgi:hypothetical protein